MTSTMPDSEGFEFRQPTGRTVEMLDEATPTFLGVPAARSPEELQGAGAAIIGLPYAIPEFPFAADLVPRHLRIASAKYRGGFLPELEIDPLATLRVVDYGDVEVDPGDLPESMERARSKVSEVIAAGAIPITIGGNAPVASQACIQAVSDAALGPVGVINLDEHGDNREVYMGATLSPMTWVARSLELPKVRPEQWVQIGMRGPGNAREQYQWFRDRGVTLLTAREHREMGTEELVRRALRIAAAGTAALWLAVDWDVLDASAAPGWDYPDPLGFGASDILHISYEVGRAEPDLAGYALMSLSAWSRPVLWLACWSILYVLAGVCHRKGLGS